MAKTFRKVSPRRPLTLATFRKLTAGLPDTAVISPRFLDPPGDEEPGVALVGIDLARDDGVSVAFYVELFYLNGGGPDGD